MQTFYVAVVVSGHDVPFTERFDDWKQAVIFAGRVSTDFKLPVKVRTTKGTA